ncbi:ProQ/FINO family protein [Ensifer sp. ENS11]|uniref:ProQ/FINO family protein n=1 Tax=Ensifer sp. ENS11 TaxID=2769291 RepID=UPI00177C2335|nr:ProQ/FINO family protein [Ensifer sp. ENS11]MBD9490449.1 ProQ/FINO family protein [Ensifer sp. ENS11]
MTKSLKVGIGPIPAREVDVSKANVINALLTRPIAVLPTKAGDPIRPFAVGLWNGIRPLLKPEYSVTTLRRATGAYLHTKRYHFSVAQPDSVRHDIDGMPAGEVSEADRLAAREKYKSFGR